MSDPYEREAAKAAIKVLQRELAEAREELSEWRTLRSWGGTPQIVDDFIKGQQSRIHAAQDAEKQRDALAEALERIADLCQMTCLSFETQTFTATKIAIAALAAVKGESHE
jgi:hypothetical protein